MGHTYKSAGVDIEQGDALVEKIGPLAKATTRPEVVSGVGGFGGLFALPPGKYREPVLVAGTDGVGTKLKLAFAAGRHDTVGIDLVAMSVNDVLCVGAEPLFFLDYFATSKLDVSQATQVIKGIAQGCSLAGCTLLGGETAEMPGFYARGDYDLAGFCVGVVERSRIVDGKRVAPGDAIIGLGSSGLHSNGFSLARRVLLEGSGGDDRSLHELLLTPTRIYVQEVLALLAAVDVRGMAHITGSGIPGNVPRCLPEGTHAVLEAHRWPLPPVFSLIAERGNVAREEMYQTFNMGLGFVVVVPREHVGGALSLLGSRGVAAWEVGHIEAGTGEPTARVVP